MYTVKQMTDFLELSTSGLHQWADRYRNVLSPNANDKERRQFTQDDVIILWTVKLLRDENLSHNDIDTQLGKGYRADPPYWPEDDIGPPALPRSELSLLRQQVMEKNAEIDRLSSQLTEANNEIERLKGEVAALERMMKALFDSK